jgi:6-phosphofructokinase
MPIAGTMDSQAFAWDIKVYTAQSGYDGFANARVAELPTDWDTDVTS